VRILFLSHHRLDVKKRLSHLNYKSIDELAEILMCKWIGNAKGEVAHQVSEVVTLHLDRSHFLDPLRELKTTLFSDRTYLSLYKQSIKSTFESTNAIQPQHKSNMQERLSTLRKNLISIGTGLAQPKELKNFFVDLVDKIIVPLKHLDLTLSEAQAVCDMFVQSFASFLETHAHSSSLQSSPEVYRSAWTRFLEAIRECLIIIYEHI
jgi:hypothetical protein